MLPALRLDTRRRSLADRLLGVSRRRRQAAYLAIGGGLKLLQPMFRRVAVLLAAVVLLPLVSIWLRLVL